MEILIGVHHFPPKFTGGGEWTAYQVAAELLTRGHGVRVMCVESIDDHTADPIRFEDDVYQGVPIRRLYMDLNKAPDPMVYSYQNPWIAREVKRMLLEKRVDIFHLFSGYLMGTSSLLTAKATGAKLALTVTDFWFACPRINMLKSNGELCTEPFEETNRKALACARCLAEQRRRHRLPARLFPALMDNYWNNHPEAAEPILARFKAMEESLQQVNAVISPSHFLLNFYRQATLPTQQHHAIRQGILQPAQPSAHHHPTGTTLRLGFTGQIAPHKGIHLLVDAVKSMPDANVTVEIYGSETAFPEYTTEIRHLIGHDSRIHLMGSYERAKMDEIYRRMDAIVVPSLCYENSPTVILEGYLFGLPAIATRLGGMTELIQDGVTGLLFSLDNVDDLARCIRQLLDNPALLAEMRANLPVVKSVATETDELEAVYASLLELR